VKVEPHLPMFVGNTLKLVALTAVLWLPPCARCDTFAMKSGSTLEGVVISDKDGRIELETGYGTVTIYKSDILKVRKTTPIQREAMEKKKRQMTFESGDFVPAGAGRLAKLLRMVRLKRRSAFEAKARKSSLKAGLNKLEKELAGLKKSYISLADELQEKDRSADEQSYYDTSAEINKTGALLNSLELRRKDFADELGKTDAPIQDYLSAYSQFADYLQGEGKLLIAKEARGIDGEYFSWVRDETKVMRADFKEDVAVSMRQGPHIIVKALINGKVSARLMVDTGASMTLLYQNVIDALNLDPKVILGTTSIIVADGRKVQASIVRIDSLEVGRAKVTGAQATVLSSKSPDIDGLLGMSFLSHFSVSVDSVHGKLTLVSLK